MYWASALSASYRLYSGSEVSIRHSPQGAGRRSSGGMGNQQASDALTRYMLVYGCIEKASAYCISVLYFCLAATQGHVRDSVNNANCTASTRCLLSTRHIHNICLCFRSTLFRLGSGSHRHVTGLVCPASASKHPYAACSTLAVAAAAAATEK